MFEKLYKDNFSNALHISDMIEKEPCDILSIRLNYAPIANITYSTYQGSNFKILDKTARYLKPVENRSTYINQSQTCFYGVIQSVEIAVGKNYATIEIPFSIENKLNSLSQVCIGGFK
jgi:hypothetical protein